LLLAIVEAAEANPPWEGLLGSETANRAVAGKPAGSKLFFWGGRAMAASDEVVFAWAIGKALLIVIVSAGILIYAAWAAPENNR
jgi:hypothetical protein